MSSHNFKDTDDSLNARSFDDFAMFPTNEEDPNEHHVFKCNLCGKEYTWMSSLRRHQLQCASSLKSWSCFRCGKRYMWRDSLKKHQRVECGKDPTFECPICGRKFKHKHRWQSHARLIHYINV